MAEDDDDDLKELTPSERKKIRKIIEGQERAEWFWSTIRIWALWISGIVGGVYALFEFLGKFIKIKLGA